MGNAQRKNKDAAKASKAAKKAKESGKKTLQEEFQSKDDSFETIQRDEIRGIDAHGATETKDDDDAACHDLVQRLDAFSTPVETVSQPLDTSKDIPLHETTTELSFPMSSEAQYLEAKKVADSYVEVEDRKSEQEGSAASEPEKAELDSKEQPFETTAAEESASIPQQQEETVEIKHDSQTQNDIDIDHSVLTGDPVVDSEEVEVAGTAVPIQETPLGSVQEIGGSLLPSISSAEQQSKRGDSDPTTDAIADAQEVVHKLSAEKSKEQAETEKDSKETGQGTAAPAGSTAFENLQKDDVATAEGLHETGSEDIGGDIVEGSASVGDITLAENGGAIPFLHDETNVEGTDKESFETPTLESEQAEAAVPSECAAAGLPMTEESPIASDEGIVTTVSEVIPTDNEVKRAEVSEHVTEENAVDVADQVKTPEIEQKAEFQDASQEKFKDNTFEESLGQDVTKVPESSTDEESSRGHTGTAAAEDAEVADLIDTARAKNLEEAPGTEDSTKVAAPHEDVDSESKAIESFTKFTEVESAGESTVEKPADTEAASAVDIEGHTSNAGDAGVNGATAEASLDSETPAVDDVDLDANSSDAVNNSRDASEALEEVKEVPSKDVKDEDTKDNSSKEVQKESSSSIEQEMISSGEVKADPVSNEEAEVPSGASEELSVPTEEGLHETVPSEETKDETVSTAKASNEDVMADLIRSKELKTDPADPLSSEVTEKTSEARASQEVEPDTELDPISDPISEVKPVTIEDMNMSNDEAADGVTSENVSEAVELQEYSKGQTAPTEASKETKDDPVLTAVRSQDLNVNQREVVSPHEVSAEEVQGDSSPTDVLEADEVANEELNVDPVSSEEAKEEIPVSTEEAKDDPKVIMNEELKIGPDSSEEFNDGPTPIEEERVSVEAVPSEEAKDEATASEESKDDTTSTVQSEDVKVDSPSSDAPIPVEEITAPNEEAKDEADGTPIADVSEVPVPSEEAKKEAVPIDNEDIQISTGADAVSSEEVNANPLSTEEGTEQAVRTEEVNEEADAITEEGIEQAVPAEEVDKEAAVTEEGTEQAVPSEEATASNKEAKDDPVKVEADALSREAEVPVPDEQAKEIPWSADKSESDALSSEEVKVSPASRKEAKEEEAVPTEEAIKDISDSTTKLEAGALPSEEVKVDLAPSEEVKEEAVETEPKDVPDSTDKSEVDALPSEEVKIEEVKEAPEDAEAKDVPASTEKSEAASAEVKIEEVKEEAVPTEEVEAKDVPDSRETSALPAEDVKIEEVKEEAVPTEEVEAKDVPLPREEVKIEEIKEAVPTEEAEAKDVPDSTDKSEANALPSEEVKADPVPSEEVKEEAAPTEEAETKEVPVSTDNSEADSSPSEEVTADPVLIEEAKEEADEEAPKEGPVSTEKSEEADGLPNDEVTKVDPVTSQEVKDDPIRSEAAPESQPLNPPESPNQPAEVAAGDDANTKF